MSRFDFNEMDDMVYYIKQIMYFPIQTRIKYPADALTIVRVQHIIHRFIESYRQWKITGFESEAWLNAYYLLDQLELKEPSRIMFYMAYHMPSQILVDIVRFG